MLTESGDPGLGNLELRSNLRRVYDSFRTALFNRKYYACRLQRHRQANMWLECVLAIGTSGTVAGLSIWHGGVGKVVWAVFGGLVALTSVLKPVVGLPKSIERFSKLWTGHSRIYYDLEQVVSDIRAERQVTPQMLAALSDARNRHRELALDDDIKPVERLRRKYYAEVNNEIPASSLWYPSSTVVGHKEKSA
jgi:hypothetical protein